MDISSDHVVVCVGADSDRIFEPICRGGEI